MPWGGWLSASRQSSPFRQEVTDPLPQALVLTAIVIGFAMTEEAKPPQ